MFADHCKLGKINYVYLQIIFKTILEPVDKVTAAREFRVLQAALHTSTGYRDSVSSYNKTNQWQLAWIFFEYRTIRSQSV